MTNRSQVYLTRDQTRVYPMPLWPSSATFFPSDRNCHRTAQPWLTKATNPCWPDLRQVRPNLDFCPPGGTILLYLPTRNRPDYPTTTNNRHLGVEASGTYDCLLSLLLYQPNMTTRYPCHSPPSPKQTLAQPSPPSSPQLQTTQQ